MRQVNRAAIPVPNALDQDLSQETQAVVAGVSPKSAIYAHVTVKSALRDLYRENCYLCEDGTGASGEVEHFQPWRTFPNLAYEWTNLHNSCGPCNGRKRKKEYKDENGFTLLLDPSQPPAGETIPGLIGFDETGDAHARKDPVAVVVQRTVYFLNDPTPHGRRLKRINNLAWYIAERACLPEWRDMLDNGITAPDQVAPERQAARLAALEAADGVVDTYFRMSQPFASGVRESFERRFGIPGSHLRAMSNRYRNWRGLPPLPA